MEHVPLGDIGITSPYRAQVTKAESYDAFQGVQVDTVYKYQGREKEAIVFSTTANYPDKFVDNPNLLNVAVSRAKGHFILVTAGKPYKKYGSNIGDLIRHIDYQSQSPSLFESKVVSIFDCLYREFSTALEDFNRKAKTVSDYRSQDLMAALLDDILGIERYSSFSYKMDYSLVLFIFDYTGFSIREEKFARNPSSHTDFMIFNKLDKSPVLAMEVDGYSTHDMNEKQLERDQCKNGIFAKLDLPLLRLSTVGSGEREKVIKALEEVLTDLPESDGEMLQGNF